MDPGYYLVSYQLSAVLEGDTANQLTTAVIVTPGPATSMVATTYFPVIGLVEVTGTYIVQTTTANATLSIINQGADSLIIQYDSANGIATNQTAHLVITPNSIEEKMKRLIKKTNAALTLLAASWLGLAQGIQADQVNYSRYHTYACPTDVYCEYSCGGPWYSADFLYWRAVQGGLDYSCNGLLYRLD